MNDTVQFGSYVWQVLETKDGKMLLLSDRVIEYRSYHDTKTNVTWETCDLREYLNGKFYDQWNTKDQERIAETCIKNPDNLWFGTEGGKDTTDRIFLLSIDEVVRYFGDSGQFQNKNPKSKLFINDQYKSSRKAVDKNGATAWWWLRSPGLRGNGAAQVYNGGAVHISGHFVNNGFGGVRPALWLKL